MAKYFFSILFFSAFFLVLSSCTGGDQKRSYVISEAPQEEEVKPRPSPVWFH